MKRLLILFVLALFSQSVMAANEPTLILEVHAKNQSEFNVVNHYLTDDTLCCLFEVHSTLTDSSEAYTQIKHKKTGVVLGTFYGTPSKEFILKIYKEQLTPEYIDRIVPKLLALREQP